jgi:hypothetical protein
MHKNYQTGEPVEAPPSVQKAKNLIEEFFGLKLIDSSFCPLDGLGTLRDGLVTYVCQLVSPTGKVLHEIELRKRPEQDWVTISGRDKFTWTKILQTAIDNFVNDPQGKHGSLGEWKPSAEKLEVVRQPG